MILLILKLGYVRLGKLKPLKVQNRERVGRVAVDVELKMRLYSVPIRKFTSYVNPNQS